MALSLIERARQASRTALQRIARQRNETRLPPSPFAEWEYDDAADALQRALDNQTIDTARQTTLQTAAQRLRVQITPLLGEAIVTSPRIAQDPIAINRAFYTGDHWQNGAGYIGPHPASTDEGAADAWNEIALAFTSKNVIAEVVDRHALGVVGKPVRWSFTVRRDLAPDEKPTQQEQQLIDEVTAIVRPWLKARNAQQTLLDAVVTLLLAERSSLRVYVPPGLSNENVDGAAIVLANTVEDALAKVYIEHAAPEYATVACDADTRLECGIWLFDGDSYSDDGKTAEYAGLCFLNERAETVIKIVSDDQPDVESEPLDLGGRLTIFEMHRKALITPTVQQQQRALNLAETMIPRNVVTGGFLERILLDAQMPGRPEIVDGKRTGRWIKEPFYTGAGTTNFVVGAEYEDEATGQMKRATPSVVYREPIKPDASIAASAKHYSSILDEVSQTHVLLNSASDPSGKSRIEARAEYGKSLGLTSPQAATAFAFIVETAIALAEAIARKPGLYTRSLRCDAQCVLDLGPLTSDEITSIEGSIGKTISQETAMAMRGIDDVGAEIARMRSDPAARAALGLAIGQALVQLTLAGAAIEGAARFIGVTEEQARLLLAPETFSTTPQGKPTQTSPQLTNPQQRGLRRIASGSSQQSQGGEPPARATSNNQSAAGGA